MKKFILAAALAIAAVPLFGFATPAFADSPGQLSNGPDNYKVRNVTQNGAYGRSTSATCNETVKYSVILANSDFGLLKDLTVKANLGSGVINASAINANGETTAVSGTATVNFTNGGSLKYVAGSTVRITSDGQTRTPLPDGVTSGGVNAGELNGSTQTFVQFEAKVHCDTPPPVTITVCDLTTKKIVTINENAFDPNKYSKNLEDCASKPEPGKITVCEISTKKIININESDFNDQKYTKDLSKCAVTPVTPPASIPNTGAGAVMGIAAAVSAIGAIAHRLWTVRRMQ